MQGCKFQIDALPKSGQVVLDQIRTVDKTRLVRRLGKISDRAAQEVLTVLGEMFAP